MYEDAQKLNKKNFKYSFMKSSSRVLKSGYAWALIFCVTGLCFLLINILLEIKVIWYIGIFAIEGAIFIGLFTMINNEK